MRYPKLREIRHALRSLFSFAYTSKFPHKVAPPFEKLRARPKYYEDGCVGCTACYQVCPVNAISYEDIKSDFGVRRKLVVNYDICIFCGQCQAACITQEGIKLSNEYDLATFDRKKIFDSVEKDLVICQECGGVVGPKDQLAWIARKVGSAAYSNPTLFLSYQSSIGLSRGEAAPAGEKANLPTETLAKVGRPDRMKIMCAGCRRKTTLDT